jgi:iron(III) transport system permease protein
MVSRAQHQARRTLLIWSAFGLAAFALLPWYLPQNVSLLKALGGVFGGAETASGMVQAARFGRAWLWIAAAALLIALAAATLPPGRRQGQLLLVAGAMAWGGCSAAALPSAPPVGRWKR